MAVKGLNDRVPVVMVMRIILYFIGDHGWGGTECSGPSRDSNACYSLF